ncbi:MAG: radical SAM protein [Desulfobulbaceae bacterium]|nr:radical SAM protein [Desulfobulbaceae bacterium]
MTNLAITSLCNRKCDYCFAGHQNEVVHMDRETYEHALMFLHRSAMDQVRLLGGEPTLHPDFKWMVERAHQDGFKVLLFTNGLIEKSILYWLQEIDDMDLSLLVNVNPPGLQENEELKRLRYTLRYLSNKISLGFNINNSLYSPEFLLALVDEFGLKRSIRLGLAHPCLDGKNRYLPTKDYKTVGETFAGFITTAMSSGVDVEFDCGFVPCMFPDSFRKNNVANVQKVGQGCGAVPDILPDGSAIHCYPLRDVLPLGGLSFCDAQSVKKGITSRINLYRHVGIFPYCRDCEYKKSNQCKGGCLASTMKRFHKREGGKVISHVSLISQYNMSKVSGIPEENEKAHWVLPYIDQSASFWDGVAKKFGDNIFEIYMPLPSACIGSGRPIQPSQYVAEFLEKTPFRISLLANPIILPDSVDKTAPILLTELENLLRKYNIKGVTVASLQLATIIKNEIPDLEITASVLMDIADPMQVVSINDVCDVLVPSSRIMRNIFALREVKKAFQGRIRLMLNEACLPGCPFRTQHFYEMSSQPNPSSLCDGLLEKQPWMRLTGSWVLPQHLHFYDGLWDELKLAGRVTLQDPLHFHQILDGYINKKVLTPDRIGGGPASIMSPVDIDGKFFNTTLSCDKNCHTCDVCFNYYRKIHGVSDHEKKKL